MGRVPFVKITQDAFKAIAAAEHHFFEEEQCGELGPLVHGLANLQHLLNSQWYFTAADALWKVLGAKGELPNLKLPEGSKELKDEKAVRLCELIDVVGAAVGIRAYHRASGLSMPTLSPVPAEDKAPLFQRVTDFCSSGLTWDSISWGPRLEAKDLNLDVYKRLGMERTKQFVGITSPYAPASKWEPALTTAYDWFQWSLDAYPPNHDFFRLLGDFHKEGASISRADMESIAAPYTGAVQCAY
ncbi:unnamed protein product [Effrenium voratum]|nr:unnamed protein product [Effrenium voratum]